LKDKFLLVMSHILVALLASVVTVAVIITFPKNEGTEYSKLVEMEQLIQEQFIGEVDKTKLEDAAANAMIGALGDRWSYYISAEEYAAFADSKKNEYVGIGIEVMLHESGNGIHVVKVVSGGPAEEAGVKAGDIIVKIDGNSMEGKSLNDASALIKGQVNTTVVLGVVRNENQMDITVTRKHLKTPVATGEMLDGNIGLIRIKNFNANCAAESKSMIDALIEQGAEKLIFDVRNNGGGYADEMVSLLDYLLPKGTLFRTENYKGEIEERQSDAAYIDLPMAVLVNGNSYSAAECFAAALSEYDAAVVVGEKTSGKGYYQVVYQLKDGAAVGLSIGKYTTPNGVNLEGVGITPDEECVVDSIMAAAIYNGTVDATDDPQIQAAIKRLTKE